MEHIHGTLFDIQHFSLHDGPGIRSTVFFKGCPLTCWWCSNPESQQKSAQLLFFRSLCAGCGDCIAACPSNALNMGDDGLRMDRGACMNCGRCAASCRNNARQLSGRVVTVEEVCDEVRQHWRIFQTSGGGVTCGGGEALSQPEFLHDLLQTLHDEIGFHTCLDSCGLAPWAVIEKILPYLDLVLLDIKHMDSGIHTAATRAGNELILANARNLAKSDVAVLVRVPLIPGFNDTDANLNALGEFMRENALPEIELMPYHTFGLNKYAALDKTYAYGSEGPPRTRAAVELLQRYGLSVLVHEN